VARRFLTGRNGSTKSSTTATCLIVQRDGQRVRLFTRNGHDWSDRFPLITEAALRNRCSSARNWKRSADGFSRRTCWTAQVRAIESSCKV
jgi:hypothetical protein